MLHLIGTASLPHALLVCAATRATRWQQTVACFSPEAWVIESPRMMKEYRKLMHADSSERTHLQPRHVMSGYIAAVVRMPASQRLWSLPASAGSSLSNHKQGCQHARLADRWCLPAARDSMASYLGALALPGCRGADSAHDHAATATHRRSMSGS